MSWLAHFFGPFSWMMISFASCCATGVSKNYLRMPKGLFRGTIIIFCVSFLWYSVGFHFVTTFQVGLLDGLQAAIGMAIIAAIIYPIMYIPQSMAVAAR